ncbi:MAG: hypothetical protein EOP74_00185 [Variovorax sp.]|nr:MAG: hypothetical protein EOP74_00185 [Variovorax sp.]
MSTAHDKALHTLEAEAALRGLVCVQTGAGNIVLSRYGGAWIFDNVGKAAAWLDTHKVEVPA